MKLPVSRKLVAVLAMTASVDGIAQDAQQSPVVMRPFSDYTLFEKFSPALPHDVQMEAPPDSPLRLRGSEAWKDHSNYGLSTGIPVPQAGLSRQAGFVAIRRGEVVDVKDFPAMLWFESPVGKKCTATQVGPNAIFTAAHCLTSERFDSTAVKIQVELKAEADRLDGVCSILPEFDYQSNRSVDWALCLLSQQRAVARLESISLERLSKGTAVSIMGYGCVTPGLENINNDLSRGDATIEKAPPETGPTVLITKSSRVALCGGDSGGPTLFLNGDTRRVVAINSHALKERESVLTSLGNDVFQSFLSGWTTQTGAQVCGFNVQSC